MSLKGIDNSDWIVAPATALVPAAIAVVRLDGPGCWEAAAKVWQGKGVPRPRHATLGHVCDGEGTPIDEALLLYFPGPHSYTGNDLVEFHCHGSMAVVSALLDALLAAGARMARPGEFTERAFFNGRMDLAQAEGVAHLIASRTRAAGRVALAQVEGALSQNLEAIRQRLVDAGAEIEARLDFPEEEIDTADRERLLVMLSEAQAGLEQLLATAKRGRRLNEGARVVIAGKPNTGKSSIFNALVGMERALVTAHPGTTRDTIEATVDLHGVPVALVDTAGVREEGAEEIERLGIERTLREIRQADLVVFVVDGSKPLSAEDNVLFGLLADVPYRLVVNKSDQASVLGDERLQVTFRQEGRAPVTELRVCALERESLVPLERAIGESLLGAGEAVEGAMVMSLRHEEQLRTASDAVRRCSEAFGSGLSGEFAMVDLNEALQALGGMLGISVDDAILSAIFSRFCIGK